MPARPGREGQPESPRGCPAPGGSWHRGATNESMALWPRGGNPWRAQHSRKRCRLRIEVTFTPRHAASIQHCECCRLFNALIINE